MSCLIHKTDKELHCPDCMAEDRSILKTRIDKLEKALEFYGSGKHKKVHYYLEADRGSMLHGKTYSLDGSNYLFVEDGDIARQALWD